jgi:hypothetical protein
MARHEDETLADYITRVMREFSKALEVAHRRVDERLQKYETERPDGD